MILQLNQHAPVRFYIDNDLKIIFPLVLHSWSLFKSIETLCLGKKKQKKKKKPTFGGSLPHATEHYWQAHRLLNQTNRSSNYTWNYIMAYRGIFLEHYL